MDDLANLKAVNVKRTEDFPLHKIRYSWSEPSEDSKMFRIETLKKSSFSFLSLIGKAFIVGVVGISLPLLERIPHEDFRLVTTIALWITGSIFWLLLDQYLNNETVAESVLAVRGLGLQLFRETKGGQIKSLIYLELPKISEILIVEGFTAASVITYIAIETCSIDAKKPKSLVLPFTEFVLPIKLVVEVTKGLRQTIGLPS
jgi:hypothetical protein